MESSQSGEVTRLLAQAREGDEGALDELFPLVYDVLRRLSRRELRLRCKDCGHERLPAFSCEGRGICPSCNTRRMAEVAAHLTDHVFPWLRLHLELGWFIWDYHGRKVVQHWGGTDGMRAEVGLVPEEGLGYVVLSNIVSGFPNAIVHRILDAYLAPETDKDWKALLRERESDARERMAETEAERIEGTRPARPISEYAGTYRDDFLGDIVVRNEASGLVLEFVGHLRGDLEHWRHKTFVASWDDTVLRKLAPPRLAPVRHLPARPRRKGERIGSGLPRRVRAGGDG